MKKLSEIQKQLKAPKNQFNKFGNYNYRNCEDILEALKPLLSDEDVFYLKDDIVLIGDRYYVKATAHFNGIETNAFARESLDKKGMDTSQITGATSSYARKYALNALFAIDDTKDADTDEHTKQVNKNNLSATDGTPQNAGYKNAAEGKKIYAEKLEKLKKISTIGDLSKARKAIEAYIEELAGWDAQIAESFRAEYEKKRKEIGDDDFINDDLPDFLKTTK